MPAPPAAHRAASSKLSPAGILARQGEDLGTRRRCGVGAEAIGVDAEDAVSDCEPADARADSMTTPANSVPRIRYFGRPTG